MPLIPRGPLLRSDATPKLNSAKATQTLMALPAPDRLSCDNHPIFEGLHPLPTNMKIFDNKVLSTEDNIFEARTTKRLSFKKALLNGLYNAASELE